MTLVYALIYTRLHAARRVLQDLIGILVIVDFINALSIVFVLDIRRNSFIVGLKDNDTVKHLCVLHLNFCLVELHLHDLLKQKSYLLLHLLLLLIFLPQYIIQFLF